MDQWTSLILTLVCAFVVGYLFTKLRIPGGMMLDGIVGAAALNLVTDQAYMPFAARFFAQSVAGGFLGAAINREKLKRLKDLILPLLLVIVSMYLCDIVVGFLIMHISPLDPTTSLASGIAGGINDVPLIAEELGADAGKVAVLQFVRLITGIAIIPFLIRFVDPKAATKAGQEMGTQGQRKSSKKQLGTQEVPMVEHLTSLAAAFAGGWIGKMIGIPGGTLLFSLVAVAALSLTTQKGRMRKEIKKAAQLFSGAYIGTLLSQKDVLELRFLLLPALVIIVVFIANCFLTSFLVRKVSPMEVKESMLATTCAGASEIALLSEDLNISQGYAADIMILHVFRVISVVSILPQVIPLLARWMG